MNIPVIGSKSEQDTVLCVVIPGMKTVYARQVDVHPNLIMVQVGPGGVVPIPSIMANEAWEDMNTKMTGIIMYGCGATFVCNPPVWWSQRCK